MSQGITVTRGYGWVIDDFEGDYPVNLAQFITDEQAEDLGTYVKQVLEADTLEVVVEPFGYSFGALALLARASTVDSYDWEHDLETLLPDRTAELQLRRELMQALDALGWDEAGLGDPKWLLLVSYG